MDDINFAVVDANPVNEDGLALNVRIEITDPHGGARQVAIDLVDLLQNYMADQDGEPGRREGVLEIAVVVE